MAVGDENKGVAALFGRALMGVGSITLNKGMTEEVAFAPPDVGVPFSPIFMGFGETSMSSYTFSSIVMIEDTAGRCRAYVRQGGRRD